MKSRWIAGCLGVCAALLLAAGAQAVHNTGAFELDGNAVSGNASPPFGPADDWDRVCHQVTGSDCSTTSNTTGATAVDWVAEPNPNSTIFSGGGSKDPNDISSWGWKDGAGGLPDKDNLLHGFAARYSLPPSATCPSGSNPTCELLFFGSDRLDNSGDAQQGVWFLQNKVTLTGPPSGNGFSGVHRTGDLLVISDFATGGTTSLITVLQWDPVCTAAGKPVAACADSNLRTLANPASANCANAPGGTADPFCGVVNPTNGTFAPWPFTDKSGNNTYLQGEFFEGGVNLSALPGNVAGECFSSVLSETRSSASSSATLKDFVLGQLQSCGARIEISPSAATNQVGATHVLTVHVTKQVGGGAFVDAPGINVTVTLTAANGATPNPAGPLTCTTGNDGRCTVSFMSATTGTVTARASATVTVNGTPFPVETDGQAGNSGDAVKTFVNAKISLTPLAAANEVNHQHTITATVQQDIGNGAGFVNAPDGTTVSFSLTNSNGANATFSNGLTTTTCTTTGGTCSVSLNSSSAGSVTIHATTTFNVCPTGTPCISVTRATGAGAPNSADATKRFVDATIALTQPTDVNEVGHVHTVTATVKQNDGSGSGFVNVPDGTVVTVSLTNSNGATASFVGDGTQTNCTTISGSCQVSLNSPTAGTVTIHATTTLSVAGVSITRSTGDSHTGDGPDLTKHYEDATITLSPLTAFNEVGHNHTITVTVQQNDGGGSGFVNSSGRPVLLSLISSNGATATFVPGGGLTTSCTTGANGTCQVVINSPTAGKVTIHASTEFLLNGVLLTRATGDSHTGDSADATKQYEDATIALSPLTATNPVGTPHTLTVTVQQNEGSGSGFVNSPNRTVSLSLTNSNGATATFVGDGTQTTCTTGANGTCQVTINSPTGGTVIIHASTTFLLNAVLLTRATGPGVGQFPGDDARKIYVQQPTSTATGQKLVIADFAKPSGFGTPTGTVTFKLFTTADCSGTPLYDSGDVTLVNGVAQTTSDPKLTLRDNGTYKWLVTYSGDVNNLPSTSPCGTELTTISGNTPGVDP